MHQYSGRQASTRTWFLRAYTCKRRASHLELSNTSQGAESVRQGTGGVPHEAVQQ